MRRGARSLLTVLLSGALALCILPLLTASAPAEGPQLRTVADTSAFNPANIITDDVFFARQSMSAAEIDAFIRVKGASCATGVDGSPCLKDFRQDTAARAADAYCSGYSGAPQETAGAIIAQVGLSCGVSPRVLLVLLQKEQGLITTTGGSRLTATRYAKATGFACPDTAACDTTYAGFQNQVYMAARQYKVYAANPTRYAYRAGRTVNVQYNPDANCGSGPITIANQATAGLYIYTPYQPNAAALAAGYGSGDGCSAYGNRNFWLYFTDWFGSTQYDAATATLPKGSLDSVTSSYGQLTLSGWTFDPDAPAQAITVHAYVDGKPVVATVADRTRSDVGAAYPGAGSQHGYQVTIPAELGVRTVCAYAINIGAGTINPQLGCMTVTNEDQGAPRGSVDSVTAVPGALDVTGWAFDRDSTSATVTVRAYVDGVFAADIPASLPRPDVAAAFGVDPAHGYSARIPVAPGNRTICLFALNVGLGTHHTGLACVGAQVPDPAAYNPVGSWDSLQVGGGTVSLSGWAVDPDSPADAPVVTLTVDGSPVTVATGAARPDVAQAVAGAGAAQGFTWRSALPAGDHQLCLSIRNTGYGTSDLSLGCRRITTVDGLGAAPVGSYDAVVGGSGSMTLTGWALDPDDPTLPSQVHVYVDGAFLTAVTADAVRPDVGRAFPGAGDRHGLAWTGAVSPGQHQVCLYAMNTGPGVTRVLGCRDVSVVDPAVPVGTVDGVTVAGSAVTVTGWTYDADAPTQSLAVHVYVDGVGVATTADQSRPDVGVAFPGVGDRHGFAYTTSLAPGAHTVCAYAINVGAGSVNPGLGCRTVRVG